MCIIVAKFTDVDMPKQEYLDNCWDNNPDGAGYMLLRPNANEVEMQKGFMNKEEFFDAVNKLEVQKEDLFVMHFRITTSGGTVPKFTHPFIVSPSKSVALRRKSSTKNLVMMHNGIIPGLGNDNISDTAQLAIEYLSAPEISDNIYSSTVLQSLVESFIGASRLAFMHWKEGLILLGDGWEQHEEVWYSRDTYKPRVVYNYGKYYTGIGYKTPSHGSVFDDDGYPNRGYKGTRGRVYDPLTNTWDDEEPEGEEETKDVEMWNELGGEMTVQCDCCGLTRTCRYSKSIFMHVCIACHAYLMWEYYDDDDQIKALSTKDDDAPDGEHVDI